MKPLEIFGHTLARAAATEGELLSFLDRECSVPRFVVERFTGPELEPTRKKILDAVHTAEQP